MIIRRKKIKLNGKNYKIKVGTYINGHLKIQYENNMECNDITIDLKDAYLEKGKIFLDPIIKNNGVLKQLKKARIIRCICGSLNYNYVDVPIAILNMGILKTYDLDGVNDHLERVAHYGE